MALAKHFGDPSFPDSSDVALLGAVAPCSCLLCCVYFMDMHRECLCTLEQAVGL